MIVKILDNSYCSSNPNIWFQSFLMCSNAHVENVFEIITLLGEFNLHNLFFFIRKTDVVRDWQVCRLTWKSEEIFLFLGGIDVKNYLLKLPHWQLGRIQCLNIIVMAWHVVESSYHVIMLSCHVVISWHDNMTWPNGITIQKFFKK